MDKFFILKKRGEKRWVVYSKRGDVLGQIYWNKRWRQYCFYPDTYSESWYSWDCLVGIGAFIKELNDKD